MSFYELNSFKYFLSFRLCYPAVYDRQFFYYDDDIWYLRIDKLTLHSLLKAVTNEGKCSLFRRLTMYKYVISQLEVSVKRLFCHILVRIDVWELHWMKVNANKQLMYTNDHHVTLKVNNPKNYKSHLYTLLIYDDGAHIGWWMLNKQVRDNVLRGKVVREMCSLMCLNYTM